MPVDIRLLRMPLVLTSPSNTSAQRRLPLTCRPIGGRCGAQLVSPATLRVSNERHRLPVAMHSDCFQDECCGSSSYGHYLFGCKWSPDATCVLACSSESKMHVFEADRWSSFTGTSAGAPDAGAAAVMQAGGDRVRLLLVS